MPLTLMKPHSPHSTTMKQRAAWDHGCEDELEEIEAEADEQSQTRTGKSQRSKNYTILEDQALIQVWSAVSLDPCTGVS